MLVSWWPWEKNWPPVSRKETREDKTSSRGTKKQLGMEKRWQKGQPRTAEDQRMSPESRQLVNQWSLLPTASSIKLHYFPFLLHLPASSLRWRPGQWWTIQCKVDLCEHGCWVRLHGFKSRCPQPLAKWPWASAPTTLCLSFLFCKRRVAVANKLISSS